MAEDFQRRSDPDGMVHFIKTRIYVSTLALTGFTYILEAILKRPRQPDAAVISKLLDIDEIGVTESEFKQLVAKCHCGLIVTRRSFHTHHCQRSQRLVRRPANEMRMQPVIIDLTGDDDEATMAVSEI